MLEWRIIAQTLRLFTSMFVSRMVASLGDWGKDLFGWKAWSFVQWLPNYTHNNNNNNNHNHNHNHNHHNHHHHHHHNHTWMSLLFKRKTKKGWHHLPSVHHTTWHTQSMPKTTEDRTKTHGICILKPTPDVHRHSEAPWNFCGTVQVQYATCEAGEKPCAWWNALREEISNNKV